ncbi:hypothetical protein SDC9_195618 [bioreactor metagenome]|uniref:Uncharacterized protein n=1 Tax=bioreactor metagenome TaxID=1076179 RepID=A0A645II81_9ZZZZ
MAGGLTAVSALSVQNNVNLFLMPVIMGVGITLSIMAGIFYGEGDFGAIERVLRVSMKFGIAACVLLAAALYVIAPYAVELILGDGGGGDYRRKGPAIFQLQPAPGSDQRKSFVLLSDHQKFHYGQCNLYLPWSRRACPGRTPVFVNSKHRRHMAGVFHR